VLQSNLEVWSWAVSQGMADPDLSAESREAFDIAYENIKAFHEAQQSPPLEVETMPGVRCRRITRPIGELTALSRAASGHQHDTLPCLRLARRYECNCIVLSGIAMNCRCCWDLCPWWDSGAAIQHTYDGCARSNCRLPHSCYGDPS